MLLGCLQVISNIGVIVGSLILVVAIFFICYGELPSDKKILKMFFSGFGIVGLSLLYRIF